MEFLRRFFSISSFLLITFLLVGCETDGILEDLDHGPTENTFCPLNRLPNGLCPSKQKANVSAVSFTNSDGSFGLDSDIYLKVTFNEEVEVTGSPRIELETGVTDRFAVYNSGSGSKNLIFKYTSQLGDINSDLDYKATSSLSLSGGKINNLYGNASILTLPAVGTLAANHAINVETSSAVVTGVSFSTSDNSYGAGSNIDITVTFNKNVDVTGSPQIELETGTTDRFASYQSGTGTSSLVFRYQVQAGDTNSDLDYKATTSLDLNGGTIKDIATNDAILTLPAVGTLATAHAVNIDTTGPTISGVSFASSNASYGVGTTVDLTVTFNEVVSVNTTGGTPQIELETGATDHFAIYQIAAASSSITFRYTVQAGNVNSDLDYKATTSLSLNSGTIKDAAGNDATLTLPAVGTLAAAHAINVETTAPTVTGVAFSSSDGNYAAASNIDMTITFSEVVNVVTTGGTPRVELETGTTDRFANYLSGTGTSTLTFRYTVQSGDVNIDLDYKATNSLTLNGGTIKDNASNNATLTLPAVGTLATAHDIGVGVTTWIWDFSSSGDYTYPSNYVEVTGGKASLKTVDTTHSGTDFNSGTHVGTYLDGSNRLALRTKPSDTETHVNTILTSKSGNLVGYWRFDNNWNDSSGNGNHGTSASGTSFSSNAKNGENSIEFDGTIFYKSISTSESVHNISRTISYWINLNSYPSSGKYYFPVYVGSGIGRLWTLRISENGDLFSNTYWGDGCDFWRNLNFRMITGQWYFVTSVISRNGSFKSYINGEELDSVLISSCASGQSFSSSEISFSHNPGSAEKLNGKIDDTSFWNTSLSSAEILNLYNKSNSNYSELSSSWTPKWDSIVGYWKMDGNWQDSSGNGNHGTGVNDASFSINSKVGAQSGTFDGSGDHVNLGTSMTSPDNYSFAAWVLPQKDFSTDSYQGVIGELNNPRITWTNAGSNVFQFLVNYATGGVAPTVTTSVLELNRWYFVVGTISGASTSSPEMRIYLNGELQNSRTHSAAVTSPDSALFLGRRDSTHSFQGQIDDASVWSIDLSSSDIKEIYNRQKQKYAGHYESPVINLGTSGNWENLKLKTTLPFYKELTTSSENSSDYPSLSGNLSDGLVGYWPLNETIANSISGRDFKDKSSNGNHGDESGGITFGGNGILSSAPIFDGIDDGIDTVDSSALVNGTNSFTISCWIKPSSTVTTGDVLVGGRCATLYRNLDGSKKSSRLGIGILGDGSDTVFAYGAGLGALTYINAGVFDGDWHHLVVTYDTSTVKLYLDGAEVNSASATLSPTSTEEFKIGFFDDTDGRGAFPGKIDEVAIWSRTLADGSGGSINEIQQVYRRGANRIKYQVKSCIDSSCNCKSYSVSPAGSSMDCDGDGTPNSTDYDDVHKADWIGKNGAGDTFSELQNCVSIDGSGNCNGDVNDTPADFIFSYFPAAAQPANNQYFQYRVLMEAEENTACTSGATCMPELESVEIGPTGRYYGGSPEVTPASSSVTYTDINKIVFANTGSCTVKYQLSKDGSTYKYWNGSAWATASGVSQANDSSTISSNIGTFTSQVGTGTLYWKAFLTSDTSQSCDLDTISVTVPD